MLWFPNIRSCTYAVRIIATDLSQAVCVVPTNWLWAATIIGTETNAKPFDACHPLISSLSGVGVQSVQIVPISLLCQSNYLSIY
jgi:hypothetical protein